MMIQRFGRKMGLIHTFTVQTLPKLWTVELIICILFYFVFILCYTFLVRYCHTDLEIFFSPVGLFFLVILGWFYLDFFLFLLTDFLSLWEVPLGMGWLLWRRKKGSYTSPNFLLIRVRLSNLKKNIQSFILSNILML